MEISYKIITSMEQYKMYCDRHEKIMFEDEIKHAEEIELIELLVQDYDKKQMKDFSIDLNPVELLESIMVDEQLNPNELAATIGISSQFLNDILKYREDISKSIAQKLANEFCMDISAFVKPYKLKKAV